MPTSYPVKNPPQTLTRTSHGIQIKARGLTIGSIASFKPGPRTREFTHIYELNPLSSGHPVDVVPGNLGGFNIAVTRYDIWTEPFEKAFAGAMDIYEALGNQDRPFELYQFMWHPDGSKEIIVYRNVWIKEVGRQYQATADRVVSVGGSFVYLRSDRIA